MNNANLKTRPYYLSENQIEWIEQTIQNMTIEEKIGQLFFTAGFSTNEEVVKNIINNFHPGGMMYRPSNADNIMQTHKIVQTHSKIPLFLSANTEEGGNGIISEGTTFGTNMQIGATSDINQAYKLGEICSKESKMVGCNMSFAPVIDINYNFRNPVTNTRAFSDDAEIVAKMGREYVRAANDNNVAITLKHFPGDGVDGRDHHLLTSINSLPFNTWMNTFGSAYKTCIEEDATGIMIGHIALPGYFDTIDEGSKHRYKPASLNPYLLQGLLRDKLQFNGLLITDSTLMAGFGCQGKRQDLIPNAIASGCDMLLFNRNIAEDYAFMMEGYKKGIISDERLYQALLRILGLKAKLGLHTASLENLAPSKFDTALIEKHKQATIKLANDSITLVKDKPSLLPLDPQKQNRIGVMYFGNPSAMEILMNSMKKGDNHKSSTQPSNKNRPVDQFIDALNKEGFKAFEYKLNDIQTIMKKAQEPMESWANQFDIIILFSKMENASNLTSLQVSYKAFGFDAPWFVKEVPTILISVSNPYQTYDFPMIDTVINAYTPSNIVYQSIAEKLVGKTKFKGKSPVSLEYYETLSPSLKK